MNKKIYLILLCSLFFTTVFAQDKPDASAKPEHKNILKINLSSIVLTNIYLQDEFTLNSHSSIALGISYLPTRSLPSAITDNTPEIKDLEFTAFSITPEYRYYFTGKSPKGFYIAPYFRYSSFTTNAFRYIITKDDGEKDTIMFNGASYKLNAVGLMFGKQWKLSNHFALDLWIVGVGYGSGTLEASGTGHFSQSDQDSFNQSVADISLPLGDLKASMTSTTASIKYTTTLSTRGGGFCLGYIF